MTRHTCPHCRAHIIKAVDNDTAGLPITLHPTPVPRLYALQAIATGSRAVIAEHDRTYRNQRTRYYDLDQHRIRNPRLATHPHYVQHVCGATPPTIPAPPPTPADQEAPF